MGPRETGAPAARPYRGQDPLSAVAQCPWRGTRPRTMRMRGAADESCRRPRVADPGSSPSERPAGARGSAVEDHRDPEAVSVADDADGSPLEIRSQDVLTVKLAGHERFLERVERSTHAHVLPADRPVVALERVAELGLGRVEQVALASHGRAVALRVLGQRRGEAELAAVACLPVLV